MIRFLLIALAVVLLAGLLHFLYRQRRALFWPAAGSVAVTLALLGGWLLTGGSGSDDFPPAQVGLAQLALAPAAGSYRLQGEISNQDTAVGLGRVTLRLQLARCQDSGCTPELDREQPMLVSLAPGASRPFFVVFPSTGAVPPGELRWQVEVVSAQGYQADPGRH